MSLWVILWDPNKAIDIGEWSICGGGQLESFCCISQYTSVYVYISQYVSMYIYIYISQSVCVCLYHSLTQAVI